MRALRACAAAAQRRSAAALQQASISGSALRCAVAEADDDVREPETKGTLLRGKPLYLDMQATTPVDPRVLDAMLPYFVEQYGNPHSRTHLYGWQSEEAVEIARARIARLIGADAKEIIFTSVRSRAEA